MEAGEKSPLTAFPAIPAANRIARWALFPGNAHMPRVARRMRPPFR